MQGVCDNGTSSGAGVVENLSLVSGVVGREGAVFVLEDMTVTGDVKDVLASSDVGNDENVVCDGKETRDGVADCLLEVPIRQQSDYGRMESSSEKIPFVVFKPRVRKRVRECLDMQETSDEKKVFQEDSELDIEEKIQKSIKNARVIRRRQEYENTESKHHGPDQEIDAHRNELVISEASLFADAISDIVKKRKEEDESSSVFKEDHKDTFELAESFRSNEILVSRGVGPIMKILYSAGIIEEPGCKSHDTKKRWKFGKELDKAVYQKQINELKEKSQQKKRHSEENQRIKETIEKSRLERLIKRYSEYDPEIKLKYYDDSGNKLSLKEAFKHMSHKFHGKRPGPLKTQKKIKKRVLEKEGIFEFEKGFTTENPDSKDTLSPKGIKQSAPKKRAFGLNI